jgi:ADP-ribosylglycohydrolase
MNVPANYLERVYAGVLGKLIGVYLGRPFEGWTYQRIIEELGAIEYYVHDRLNVPLVVTDDDVSGTFTFVRALAEHGVKPDLSAEEIGKTWLNAIVEQRSILWWGGNGNSTEHTAWLNLKRGVPAPHSGSIATNGQAVAEQIGAQIFIDGWALVAPGRPKLAAQLAEAAGSVSHDGESVHAAKLLAAMEAEAFLSSDIDHLIDVGLSVIPGNSLIARLVADVRGWHAALPDWRDVRQKIEDQYGYDKFPGNCPVVPNHALIILALLYSAGDFHQAMTIVNTAGWDTDCNSGNIGCLIGVMHGLKGLEGGPDWRGPLADRTLISASDGGYAVNDAARIAYDVANLGRELAGLAPLPAPKAGAQFHFTLPGSVQGFMAEPDSVQRDLLSVEQGQVAGAPALALRFKGLARGRSAAALTPTFSPPNVVDMRTYDLQASPRVYSGQTVKARVIADAANTSAVTIALRIKVYGRDDHLEDFDGPPFDLAPGAEGLPQWTLPDLDGQPIQQIGVSLTSHSARADGTIWLDYLSWEGPPKLKLRRPKQPSAFWRQSWVNNVSFFSKNFAAAFRISQDRGAGIIIHGTREWTDYRVSSDIAVHLGSSAGIAARVQGLRRYYALLLEAGDWLRLVKVRDDARIVLEEAPFRWSLEKPVSLALELCGESIAGFVDGAAILHARDDGGARFADGGIGLVIAEGALSTDQVKVGPLAKKPARSRLSLSAPAHERRPPSKEPSSPRVALRP